MRTRVHGPRESGATFLAQFATKEGMNTQLLTLTLGPIELWAFSTTVEDANLRNRLYHHLGPTEARRVLARLFPNGSIKKLLEKRLANLKEEQGLITEDARQGLVEQIAEEILTAYTKDPNFQSFVV